MSQIFVFTMHKGFPAKCGRLTISWRDNMVLVLGRAVEVFDVGVETNGSLEGSVEVPLKDSDVIMSSNIFAENEVFADCDLLRNL